MENNLYQVGLTSEKSQNEQLSTITSFEQIKVEKCIQEILSPYCENGSLNFNLAYLHREQHVSYLKNGLRHLPEGFSLRKPNGSFIMHEGGEVDIRGAYCAISVATLANVKVEGLFANTAMWITDCQSYEGGFGGAPGLEAHGGYTFCGLASLTLLGAQNLCDIQTLLRWGVCKQMGYEGGFQGRTNKLVDGCYSFWQGGLFPILHSILMQEDANNLSAEKWLFNQEALQEYLIFCCQYIRGGLIDKPGKPPDFYHTCYTLSGLSVAQHFTAGKCHKKLVIGSDRNELELTHPLFNIGVDSAFEALQFFRKLDVPILSSS